MGGPFVFLQQLVERLSQLILHLELSVVKHALGAGHAILQVSVQPDGV